MGKMKELFMKTYFPDHDLEREYLIDDSISRDQEYEEYLQLQGSLEMNTINSKIEVITNDGEGERKQSSRIEVSSEEYKGNRAVETA